MEGHVIVVSDLYKHRYKITVTISNNCYKYNNGAKSGLSADLFRLEPSAKIYSSRVGRKPEFVTIYYITDTPLLFP